MSSESDTTLNPPSSSHAPPKNVPWTFDENDILLLRVHDYVDSRGRPKWAAVAKGLPGRTAQEARCRYRRISDAETRRKRGESFRNKCHTCGQLRRGHVCPGVTVASRDAKLAAARAGCPEVRANETQRPAAEQATEAVAAPLPFEIKVAEEAPVAVEELVCAPCEETDAPKLEVEVSFEKLEVSAPDIEDSKTADEREAFPLLPNSMQSPTVMPESPAPVSLQEFLAKFDAAVPASLDRQPSLDIMSFFNTTDEMTLSAPKDSFTALGLGASLIEVM
jgi:hypothetical protein